MVNEQVMFELREEVERLRTRVAEFERAAAENELNRRLAQVVVAMPDGVGLAYPDGAGIYVNRGLKQMAGIGEDEPFDLRIGAFHSPSVAKIVFEQALPATVQHGIWMGDAPILRRDGSELPTQAVMMSHRDKDGQIEFMSAIFRDASAQKAAENELERFFNLSADIAAIFDFEGNVCRFNDAWQQTLAYSMDEFRAMRLLSLVHPDDFERTHSVVTEAVAKPVSTVIQFENRFRHKDGSYRWLEWRAFVSVEEKRTYAVARDITGRKEAEETIRKQSAALLELSTPLIPINNEIVVMPLIGMLDSVRIAQVMDTLLEGIGKTRARVAIMDITGVTVVDTRVASALIRAAKAVSLLGAEAVLTGVRPSVAQTLVTLGADLGDIVTCGTLENGIAYAMRD